MGVGLYSTRAHPARQLSGADAMRAECLTR